MPVISIHSPDQIERVLRRNLFVHLYELGDLDDFFWPYTIWYGMRDEAALQAVCLIYTGESLPVLLATHDDPGDAMRRLLHDALHLFPARLYAHLDPALVPLLADTYRIASHGLHWKMGLVDPSRLDQHAMGEVIKLAPTDRAQIEQLYAVSYPGNWFDPRMLETGYILRHSSGWPACERGRRACIFGALPCRRAWQRHDASRLA